MIDKLLGLASLKKTTQGLSEDIEDSGQLERNIEFLNESIKKIAAATNTMSKSGEAENFKGS